MKIGSSTVGTLRTLNALQTFLALQTTQTLYALITFIALIAFITLDLGPRVRTKCHTISLGKIGVLADIRTGSFTTISSKASTVIGVLDMKIACFTVSTVFARDTVSTVGTLDAFETSPRIRSVGCWSSAIRGDRRAYVSVGGVNHRVTVGIR